MTITPAQAREEVRLNFSYDVTGFLVRIKHHHKTRVGDKFGTTRPDGRVIGSFLGVLHYAHRLIWIWHHGEIPDGIVIDHINGNPSDNRIENLRSVPMKINLRNKRKSIRNKSGHTGVYLNKSTGKWHAQSSNMKTIYLGEYNSIREAAEKVSLYQRENGYTNRHGK